MLRYAILAVALTLTNASLQSKWAVFKHKYSKEYVAEEDNLRRYVYQSNLKLIEEHNKKYSRGEVSFFLGENQFADMTSEDFAAKMNTMTLNVELPETVTTVDVISLPPSVNWLQKGYVTSVRNQGDFGASWAFSAIGAIEGQHFNATGKLVSLSEANIVECCKTCRSIDEAFQYVIDNKGVDTRDSYPRPLRHCAFNVSNVGATISSYKDIMRNSEKSLQEATANVGPISVLIDASRHSFQFYAGGVYDDRACNAIKLDHAVLVVGYGNDKGKDFWLVKNSWGTNWGMEGYIKMSRNKKNQCGIASMASYPLV